MGGTAENRERAVVLVANGDLPPAAVPYLHAARDRADFLIGVDGGTRHLARLGLPPDYVTGDFDSLGEEERAALAARGTKIVPTPDQDYTDLDKALAFAIDTLGARSVRVFAASAGRLDHVYSNLSAVLKHGRRADVRLVDESGETWLVNGRLEISGPDLPGRTVSLLAFGTAEGVTTTGVRWPLSGESLAPGVRDGTLNEVVAEAATVEVARGDLLVMLHHAAPAAEFPHPPFPPLPALREQGGV